MTDAPGTSGSIRDVATGMTVVDITGKTVGTVNGHRVADAEAGTGGGEAPQGSGSWLASLVDILSTDVGMSQDAQERLIRHGWVRVDARGPFSGHRYVAADQIAMVSDDEVRLSVTEEQLLIRAPGDRLP